MPRKPIGKSVFDAALDRMIELYESGDRIVVSFSGGKDSGICLELAIMAARMTESLPVEVVMRDEEIMFPGTFEYASRVAEREEVDFHWLYACQPVVNIYNRAAPYFWVFDPLLDPEDWVRRPPDIAYQIDELNIQAITSTKRFPPDPGKRLITITGLRTAESINRARGLFASGSYITTRKTKYGTYYARPIYDWKDGDVWKAIKENGWDYNEAYDVMHRLGLPRNQLRIAPPTLSASGASGMKLAARAWPRWFDKVCKRLPGARAASHYGRRVLEPQRRIDETWHDAFQRLCIDEAPDWIEQRARFVSGNVVRNHARHSSQALPDVRLCPRCGQVGSWKHLTKALYSGDPFCSRVAKSGEAGNFQPVEPDFFRPGAGQWDGSPTF